MGHSEIMIKSLTDEIDLEIANLYYKKILSLLTFLIYLFISFYVYYTTLHKHSVVNFVRLIIIQL